MVGIFFENVPSMFRRQHIHSSECCHYVIEIFVKSFCRTGREPHVPNRCTDLTCISRPIFYIFKAVSYHIWKSVANLNTIEFSHSWSQILWLNKINVVLPWRVRQAHSWIKTSMTTLKVNVNNSVPAFILFLVLPFCDGSKAKRHIGITLSVICLSVCHALLLLALPAFRGILV